MISPIAPPHDNYSEFYNDETRDPYPTYASIMNSFVFSTNTPATEIPTEVARTFVVASATGDHNAF